MQTITEPVRISPEVKSRIVSMKVHPRETVNDVLRRLLDERDEREGKPQE